MNLESTHILHIKNMVCPRCVKVVAEELNRLGHEVADIKLGLVELRAPITATQIQEIKVALDTNGFELLDDKKSKVVEKIKILIIEGIREGKFSDMNINLSQYISEHVHMEYTHLSSLFSALEGKSIERFMILQKIERVKELITYNELSIKLIADQLGYSSLQALSNQFKKETGMTPTAFKALALGTGRRPINEL